MKKEIGKIRGTKLTHISHFSSTASMSREWFGLNIRFSIQLKKCYEHKQYLFLYRVIQACR